MRDTVAAWILILALTVNVSSAFFVQTPHPLPGASSTIKPDPRLSYNIPQNANCGFKLHQSHGNLLSHPGFSKSQLYEPGTRCRWEIESTRKGNVTIRFESIGIREFDYAVVIDGSLEGKLGFMCNVDRYKALGTAGNEYLGINHALLKRTPQPTFTSSTNRLLVDFCTHIFPTGTSRTGFEATFQTIAPAQPNPPEGSGINLIPIPAMPIVSPAPSPPHTCGRLPNQTTARIVGGSSAPRASWPWMCSLVHGRRHQCGCAVIGEQWVITAGHCFPRIIEQDAAVQPKMAVVIGTQDLKNARLKNLFDVERIVRHEEYINYRGISHDVALVKLRVPLQFTANVQAVCLPTRALDQVAVNGRVKCLTAGWGVTNAEQISELGEIATGPDDLQQLTIDTLYTNDECRLALNKDVSDVSSQVRITDTMFCAGFRVDEGGHDACQGDSGGPLVCEENGRWVLHGLVSYGLGCARPGIPGIYSKISALRPWIRERMESN
ncbi:transmembrane protease serine 9-like [Paramacrobiotus metropolitanus]|uniref:transmembrane protease serine 9-like n=1 Tax=Paramacrobiotus metropolitanus TaxID=2943436 RepID=UPI002445777C|nr:transmembrane protease serine 9-like [Paramacrobiotus metropolitanus]